MVIFNRSEINYDYRWSWLEGDSDSILVYKNGRICKDMSTTETVSPDVTKTTKWEI